MFEKLDAYDIIANLVPGAALTYAISDLGFSLPAPDKWVQFLVVSFVVGVTLNRAGSLILDPILRARHFLGEKDYPAFLKSEQKDRKLEVIVANHGLFRTFAVAGFVYLCVWLIKWIEEPEVYASGKPFAALVILGIVLFLYALRKEDEYLQQRIANSKARPNKSKITPP